MTSNEVKSEFNVPNFICLNLFLKLKIDIAATIHAIIINPPTQKLSIIIASPALSYTTEETWPVTITSTSFVWSLNEIFCHTGKKNVEINAAMYKNKNIVWILCIMSLFCTKKYKIDLKIEIFY